MHSIVGFFSISLYNDIKKIAIKAINQLLHIPHMHSTRSENVYNVSQMLQTWKKCFVAIRLIKNVESWDRSCSLTFKIKIQMLFFFLAFLIGCTYWQQPMKYILQGIVCWCFAKWPVPNDIINKLIYVDL